MRRFRVVGLCSIVVAAVLFSAQIGSAKTQPSTVKSIAHPVWTLAMDWPRVAYATGDDPTTGGIHVWNIATGATSAIDGGRRGFAVRRTGAIAIKGKRVVWIRAQQLGNTELNHWLYTAPIGGSAHLLKHGNGYTGGACGDGGPQMGGLAGSGKAVVVSTWKADSDGSDRRSERLALVTPTQLQTIATGADAILSQSVDGGHIAVLPMGTVTPAPEGCTYTPPTSVLVYSTTGDLLKTIPLPVADPSTIGYQVAIRGDRLVLLTFGLHQPDGPAWVTLSVYTWATGALEHTWPVDIPKYPGLVNFSFYGNLAAVEGASRLHLVNLDTGNDARIAPSSRTVCNTAIGPHGLVYAVNPHGHGKLVFVPTAKLHKLVG